MGQSLKECERCNATAKKGGRCKNRTCKGKLCWLHLKSQLGLRIKKSSVPGGGLGLFTTRRFNNKEKIQKYSGEELTRAQVDQRYGDKTGEYVLCSSKKRCIDGRKTNSSAARFANDSHKTKFKNNAKFSQNLVLTAGSNGIPADREIFVGYGREYWR